MTGKLVVVAVILAAAVSEVQAFTLPICVWAQTDTRWAGDRMGNGGTIGQQGCMMTCVASALRATPKDLNNFLNRNGGYAPGGIMFHNAAAAYDGPGGLRFVGFGNFPANAGAVNLDIWCGRCWIVYSRRFAASGRDHWVLVYASNAYQCQYMDPADGTVRWVGDGWVSYGNRAVLYSR